MKAGLSGLAVERISTADQVAAGIRERILLGQIEPGTRLREAELAALIGVSRNTLREALRILTQEGLVRHAAHRGIRVAELSAAAAREIYHIRHLLEIRAVETSRPPEAALAQIEEAVEQLERTTEEHDWAALVEADMRFHRLVVGLLGSERLNIFFGHIVAELRVGLLTANRVAGDRPGLPAGELPGLSGQHRTLFELLSAGKREACAKLLKEHLDEAERVVCAVLADD